MAHGECFSTIKDKWQWRSLETERDPDFKSICERKIESKWETEREREMVHGWEELMRRRWIESSVTILGNLLHFGQLFKVCSNNYLAQTAHILRQIFVNVSKSFIFLVQSFLGNFYSHLATFYWSHWSWSSLVEGPNSQTCMESYHVSGAYFVWICHKHNSSPLGPIRPSSPSTKELLPT